MAYSKPELMLVSAAQTLILDVDISQTGTCLQDVEASFPQELW